MPPPDGAEGLGANERGAGEGAKLWGACEGAAECGAYPGEDGAPMCGAAPGWPYAGAWPTEPGAADGMRLPGIVRWANPGLYGREYESARGSAAARCVGTAVAGTCACWMLGARVYASDR
jgi:hypothetical protein